MAKQKTKNHLHFDDSELLRQEKNFISYYADGNKKSISLLLKLYNGHYWRLLFSAIFFFIKESPGWVIPIVTSYVIDVVTVPENGDVSRMVFALLGLALLVALNLPTHYIHTKLFAIARRSVEAGLRGAMIRKLQQLSISFHKEMQSGRIQSKVMRDVEAIEALSSQVFTNVLGIVINLVISLSVILVSNPVVFVFFLLCTPVAALTVVAFRKKMNKSNTEFRQGVEQTSAEVLDMVELIPVTRAHALEESEKKNLPTNSIWSPKRVIVLILFSRYSVPAVGLRFSFSKYFVWV